LEYLFPCWLTLSPWGVWAGVRCVSYVLAVLLVVAVSVLAVAVAYNAVSWYVEGVRPRGEFVDSHLVVHVSSAAVGVAAVKATLFVTCSGPNCDKYFIADVVMEGYTSSGGRVELAHLHEAYVLRQGVTRVDVVGYYPADLDLREVVVSFQLCPPSGEYGYCRVVYESATVG